MNLIRLLIFILFIYLGYRILKTVVMILFMPRPRNEEGEEGSSKVAELIQDPQCGIYFLKQRGVEARIQGREVHFCSRQCRDDYLKSHP